MIILIMFEAWSVKWESDFALHDRTQSDQVILVPYTCTYKEYVHK